MTQRRLRFFLSYLRHEPEELRSFFSELTSSETVLLPYTGELPARYRVLKDEFDCVELVNLAGFDAWDTDLDDWDLMESILESLFSDPSTPLIWERGTTSAKTGLFDYVLGGKKSFLKANAEIAKDAVFFLQFFKATKPSFLLFGFTPHTKTSWIRMKVAQRMEIPAFVINRCGVDGFYSIAQRIGRKESLLEIGPLSNEDAAVHEERLEHIVESTLSSYENAQPEYERLRFKKNRGQYVRLSQVVRSHWYAPARAVNTFRCWRQLQRTSRPINHFADSDYAVFFLHYQPEATTVPNGDLFGSQLNAILALRATLPSHVKILV